MTVNEFDCLTDGPMTKKQPELFCVVKKTKSVQKLVHQYSAGLINSDNMSEWVT